MNSRSDHSTLSCQFGEHNRCSGQRFSFGLATLCDCDCHSKLRRGKCLGPDVRLWGMWALLLPMTNRNGWVQAQFEQVVVIQGRRLDIGWHAYPESSFAIEPEPGVAQTTEDPATLPG